MSEFKITEEQFIWLRWVLQSELLKEFDKADHWYNFTQGLNIKELIRTDRYWSNFRINDKIREILVNGEYNIFQQTILQSVRVFCIEEKQIRRINGDPLKGLKGKSEFTFLMVNIRNSSELSLYLLCNKNDEKI